SRCSAVTERRECHEVMMTEYWYYEKEHVMACQLQVILHTRVRGDTGPDLLELLCFTHSLRSLRRFLPLHRHFDRSVKRPVFSSSSPPSAWLLVPYLPHS